VTVVDASVIVPALANAGAQGYRAREWLRGRALFAPELIDLEVASALRRQVTAGELTADRAAGALDDLAALPLSRAPHAPLLRRCWELRSNLTVYDAAYVALAEALEVPLITADVRLTRAPGLRCAVELAK
jgi:predicted nucleic acid-binding protein